MFVSHQLLALRQRLQWSAFESGVIAVDILQHPRFEHEEGPIDPAFPGRGFFLERRDAIILDGQMAESRRQTYGCNGCELAVAMVESQQHIHIQIRHPVRPGQHEGFIGETRSQTLDPAAGCSQRASVYTFDRPIRLPAAGDRGCSATSLEMSGNLVRLVSGRDDKIRVTEPGIDRHDALDDRHARNLHERLGFAAAAIAQPSALPAR